MRGSLSRSYPANLQANIMGSLLVRVNLLVGGSKELKPKFLHFLHKSPTYEGISFPLLTTILKLHQHG